MSNEIKVTVRGWVGSQPVRHVVSTGKTFTRFRVASTPRVRDGATGQFRDGPTEWFTVKAWQDLAENIVHSLHKGTPVVVSGTLVTETWQTEDGERSANVIKVDAIGPDLNKGTANFVRTVRGPTAEDGGERGTDGTAESAGTGAVAGLTGPDGVRFTGEELSEDEMPDAMAGEELPEESDESTDYELTAAV